MTFSVALIFATSFVCQCVGLFAASSTFTGKDKGTASTYKPSRTIARCIFWIQYNADTFIYAIRNPEFRHAYVDLFKTIISKITGGGKKTDAKTKTSALSSK